MNKRLSFVASVFLASFALGIAGAGIAYANDDDGDGEFRWLAATGLTEFGPLCEIGGPPCPDAALASNGDMIEITGEGTLEIDDGDPEDVSGGGSYRILKPPYTPDDVVDVGSWTATKLKSFVPLGPGTEVTLPQEWKQGLAVIRILMVSEFDGVMRKGTLKLGCQLPNDPADVIEGIRLNATRGQNFKLAPPLVAGTTSRSTLFIQLDDDD
jgi:hypothetical protein